MDGATAPPEGANVSYPPILSSERCEDRFVLPKLPHCVEVVVGVQLKASR